MTRVGLPGPKFLKGESDDPGSTSSFKVFERSIVRRESDHRLVAEFVMYLRSCRAMNCCRRNF